MNLAVENVALDEESDMPEAEPLAQSVSLDKEPVVEVPLSQQPILTCQACCDNPDVTLPTKTVFKKLYNWEGSSIYIYIC